MRWEVEFGNLRNINIWKVGEEEEYVIWFIVCILFALDNNLWGQELYYFTYY